MEKKSDLITVTVQLKGEKETVRLRDKIKFAPEEALRFEEIFGKTWLNDHPIMNDNFKLTLDLSMYPLDTEDLQYFAYMYNSPLQLVQTIEQQATSLSHIRRFQKVAQALGIRCVESDIGLLRDQFFAAKKILVLIDLNGTLVCKSEKELACDRPFDLKLKRNHFYLRPGYAMMLRKIMEHPRSVLAIYSSMIQTNVLPIKGLLFRDPTLKKMEGKCLEKIFDRGFNSKDPLGDEHATVRDLSKVWKAPELKGRFGPQNTLVIDSDEKKVRNCRANSFLVFPYIDDYVINNVCNNTYYMRVAGDYISGLLDKADDVPEYLMKTEFTFDQGKFTQEDLEFKKVLEEQKARLAKESIKKAEKMKLKAKAEEEKKDKSEVGEKPAAAEKKADEGKMSDITSDNIKKMETIDI